MSETNEEEWDERKFPLPRKYYLLLNQFYKESAARELKKERKKKNVML